MTTSKQRRENAWKIRKQARHHKHGKVPSLHELARDTAETKEKPDSMDH